MFIDIVPKKIDPQCVSVIQIMPIYVLIAFEMKLLALTVIKKSKIKFGKWLKMEFSAKRRYLECMLRYDKNQTSVCHEPYSILAHSFHNVG